MKSKLFWITSTPKGPHERGTHCLERLDHGYYLAKTEEEAIEQLNAPSLGLEGRKIRVHRITAEEAPAFKAWGGIGCNLSINQILTLYIKVLGECISWTSFLTKRVQLP